MRWRRLLRTSLEPSRLLSQRQKCGISMSFLSLTKSLHYRRPRSNLRQQRKLKSLKPLLDRQIKYSQKVSSARYINQAKIRRSSPSCAKSTLRGPKAASSPVSLLSQMVSFILGTPRQYSSTSVMQHTTMGTVIYVMMTRTPRRRRADISRAYLKWSDGSAMNPGRSHTPATTSRNCTTWQLTLSSVIKPISANALVRRDKNYHIITLMCGLKRKRSRRIAERRRVYRLLASTEIDRS
jgi:hypothetical protein